MPSGTAATVSGNVTLAANWSLSGGSLTVGSGSTLDVTGTLTWSAGYIDGPGQVTVGSGGHLTSSIAASSYEYLYAPIVVDGTFSLSTATTNAQYLYLDACSGGSVTVASGGAFDLTSDDNPSAGQTITGCGNSSASAITVQNGGSLSKTGGSGTSIITNVVTTVQGTLERVPRCPGRPEPDHRARCESRGRCPAPVHDGNAQRKCHHRQW